MLALHADEEHLVSRINPHGLDPGELGCFDIVENDRLAPSDAVVRRHRNEDLGSVGKGGVIGVGISVKPTGTLGILPDRGHHAFVVGIGDLDVVVVEEHEFAVGGFIPVGEGPFEAGMPAAGGSNSQVVIAVISLEVFRGAPGRFHIPRHKARVECVIGVLLRKHVFNCEFLGGGVENEFLDDLESWPVYAVFGGLGPNAQNVDAAKIVQAGIEVGGVGNGPDENGVGIGNTVFVHEKTFVATLL